MLTQDACYRALEARDPRFDGVFYVGVATTGIYCRPVCPARTPGRARCAFYATAAQAEVAGFRACFRCRPELAPGASNVDAVDALVRAATEKISEGALVEGSVDDLAAALGVSARHLRRAMEARLGVSPIELAQTRRLALAKQLLQDTSLPITEVAFAAGFESVRRFNSAVRDRLGAAPSELRRSSSRIRSGDGRSALTLRLDYRAPYAWDHVLAFLGRRAIPGVELVDEHGYRRVVHAGGATGTIAVRAGAAPGRLALDIDAALTPSVMSIVARVRRQFDLDARPDLIASVLGRDRALSALVRRIPGLRVPGAVDPFEASVRALLGQQVSVAAATTLAGRVARAFGASVVTSVPGLECRFPTAAEVATVTPGSIAGIGIPTARGAAIHALATAVASGRLRFDALLDVERTLEELVSIPGIGPWTAQYLAMRALHLPDAFPAGDLGIKKALGGSTRDIEARAEAWRPYRSYAVMYLWTSLGEPHAVDDPRLPARTADARRTRRSPVRRVPADPAHPARVARR